MSQVWASVVPAATARRVSGNPPSATTRCAIIAVKAPPRAAAWQRNSKRWPATRKNRSDCPARRLNQPGSAGRYVPAVVVFQAFSPRLTGEQAFLSQDFQKGSGVLQGAAFVYMERGGETTGQFVQTGHFIQKAPDECRCGVQGPNLPRTL